MKKMLMMFGAVMVAVVAFADDPKPEGGPYTETVESVTWTFMVDAELNASVGNSYGGAAIPTSTAGDVTIPSMLGGRTVTSIGDYAFYECTGLTSVTIPSSVMSIGDWAFSHCGFLERINVDANNKTYASQDGVLFDAAMTVLIQCPGGKEGAYTIPSSVTSIGNGAFAYCSSLTSVTIPSSVTSIEDQAFYSCRLSKIQIPEGVTNIGSWAFAENANLNSVSIPSSVKSTGYAAFRNCTGLTSVTIAEGVEIISEGSFLFCRQLSSLNIPSSVTNIGDNAFFDCRGLGAGLIVVDGCVLTMNDKYTHKGPVDISVGVRLIAGGAFAYCSGVTRLTIPATVTIVGDCAFSGCTNLEAADFVGAPPEGIRNAGIRQYYADVRYNVVYQDEWIPIIEECGLSATPYAPCGGPYEEIVDGIAWTYIITNGVASVGTGRYQEPAISIYTQNSVEVPSLIGGCPVRIVGDFAFDGCSYLSGVTIPGCVTNIGASAFANCSGLFRVDIPDGVATLNSGIFSWCTSLEYVSIPDTVTSIGETAFAQCYKMNCVYISSNVTHIGRFAFEGCNNIDGVHISDMAAWCKIKFDDATSNPLYYAKKLYVNGVESGPEIPNGVKDIGPYSFCGHWFEGCSLAIPVGVTNVGEYAFAGCAGLTDATIPEGVPSIADGVFSGCSRMTEVTMPTSVKSIGKESFCGCSGLLTAIIPDGATSVGAYAFAGCSSLSTLSIPKSVVSIGIGAFSGCQGLGDGVVVVDECVLAVNGDCPSEVVLPDGVRLVASGAFQGSAIERIVIPSSVTSVGDEAFRYCTNLNAVDFEGAPPDGVVNAGFKTDAAIRYNVAYKAQWEPVVESCGWTNATPYVLPKPEGGPYKETVDGIEWTFMVTNGEARVGTGKASAAIPTTTKGAITVPSELGGRPVTGIGNDAFAFCTSLTGVTIPEGVKSIGATLFYLNDLITELSIPASVTNVAEGAFYACFALQAIRVADDNQHYISPDDVLYTKDGTSLVCCPAAKTSVSVLDSVTNICSMAFGECRKLTSITLPPKLSTLGNLVFYSCPIKELTFPGSVTRVGANIFPGCALNAVYFEGMPPIGVESACIENKTDAILYNGMYKAQWEPVVAACGWTNAQPYTPMVEPGGEIVVPEGKAEERATEINNDPTVKAQYLKAPGGVETTADYLACFDAVATSGSTVAFVLNEEGTNEVLNATSTIKTTTLDVVLSVGSTVTIDEPLVGFYYSLKQGANVSVSDQSDLNKLGGRDSISFELTKGPLQYFYQTIVSPTPVSAE